MKPAYHIPVLLAFLLYFVSFLTGRPGIDTDPYAEQSNIYTEQHSDEDFNFDSSNKKAAPGESYWKTGLIKRVYLQKKARTLLDDTLLVSDARPESFFKNIDRTLTGDAFFLSLDMIWISMFLLAITALLKKHWFYSSFLKMLIYPSIAFLLVTLLTVRRENLIFSNGGAALLIEIFIETVLMFTGLILVFSSTVPRQDANYIPFMEHLGIKSGEPMSDTSARFHSFVQVIFLVIAGVILSNLILLPIYKLQVTFPGLFAMLFIFALIALGFFYTTAYMRVSSSKTSNVSVFSGISFLGYRIMRNSIFIIKIIITVSLVIGTVLSLASVNIEFLQSIEFLQKSGGFQ